MKFKLIITHLQRMCREGSYLPPWYFGLSYHNYEMRCDVFHIMPLNFFIRWGRFIQYKWDKFRSNYGYVERQINLRVQWYSEEVNRSFHKRVDKKVNERLGDGFARAVKKEVNKQLKQALEEMDNERQVKLHHKTTNTITAN